MPRYNIKHTSKNNLNNNIYGASTMEAIQYSLMLMVKHKKVEIIKGDVDLHVAGGDQIEISPSITDDSLFMNSKRYTKK